MRSDPGRLKTSAALVISALVVTAAGCTGGGSSGGDSSGGVAEQGSPGVGQAGHAASAAKPGAAQPKQRGKLPELSQHGKIVYTTSLEMRVDDVSAAMGKAKRMVRDVDGYVHDGHITTNSESGGADAKIVLKIPVEHYRKTLDHLTDIGTLLDRKQSAKDVTEEVADVTSRVKSAQASIKRLRQLLDRADSVKEMLKVEQELSEREAKLESLQARADALQQKTSYATVTLRLHGPKQQAVAATGGPAGFFPALSAGWGAFTTFWAGVVTALGAALPFLVLVAVFAAAAGWFRRYWRRHRAASDTGPDS